jgi:hypothetical protein
MGQRTCLIFRPQLEPLEAKYLLSGGASATHPAAQGAEGVPHQNTSKVTNIKLDRITNPKGGNSLLFPPFSHVLVQQAQPVPGRVYNVLFISVLNGTGQTFHASDNIQVKTRNQPPGLSIPILTGDQEWKPGERIVFYRLTKEYYPLSPTQTSGFVFNFVKPMATAIPGPSGIFLRLKYDPATFNQVLDHIVSAGIGARGHQLGLPDTAIWEIYPPNFKYIRL